MSQDITQANFADLTELFTDRFIPAGCSGTGAEITKIHWPKPGKLRVRNPVRRSNLRTTYKYPCITVGRMVQCDSEPELHGYMLLDAFPSVTSMAEQPMRIDFEVDGQAQKHYPDAWIGYGRRHPRDQAGDGGGVV